MIVWTFGRKLMAGVGIVVVLTSLMAWLTASRLSGVVEAYATVAKREAPLLVDAEELRGLAWEMSARGRTFLATGEGNYVTEARDAAQRVRAVIARIEQRGLDAEEQQALLAVREAGARWLDHLESFVARRRAGELGEEVVAYDVEVSPLADALRDRIADFTELERRRLEARIAGAEERAELGRRIAVGFGGGLAAFVLVFGWWLTRNLTQQVGSTVQHVRTSSAELRTTAAQQASGAREQAVAMTEVSTTVDQLLASSRQIAESARRVAALAAEADEAARNGSDAVAVARRAVAGIHEQVQVVVRQSVDLGERSKQAGAILDIVDELAEQTNILAINATIEAAGAGESGRRFGVVAEEIRRLADRMKGSTREIREHVEQIRAAVGATMMATESGSKAVDAGVTRFDDVAAAFARIGAIVETTTEAAREIELSTHQQSTAVEQVSVAVSSAAQATREAEVGAAQTARTAADLLSMADELARLVQAPAQQRA